MRQETRGPSSVLRHLSIKHREEIKGDEMSEIRALPRCCRTPWEGVSPGFPGINGQLPGGCGTEDWLFMVGRGQGVSDRGDKCDAYREHLGFQPMAVTEGQGPAESHPGVHTADGGLCTRCLQNPRGSRQASWSPASVMQTPAQRAHRAGRGHALGQEQ